MRISDWSSDVCSSDLLTIAITSDTLPLTEVQNLVNTRIALKISQVDGVGLVTLSGGQRPAMRVQVDTQALASHGITIGAVRSAISSANANSAKGSFDGPSRSYSINANDQLETVDDYRNLVVTYQNGAPVRLSDVADIVESAENVKLGAWANTKPAIILNVQRQPRSEEHTSELQSLMRISYAVFCLKKKNT